MRADITRRDRRLVLTRVAGQTSHRVEGSGAVGDRRGSLDRARGPARPGAARVVAARNNSPNVFTRFWVPSQVAAIR